MKLGEMISFLEVFERPVDKALRDTVSTRFGLGDLFLDSVNPPIFKMLYKGATFSISCMLYAIRYQQGGMTVVLPRPHFSLKYKTSHNGYNNLHLCKLQNKKPSTTEFIKTSLAEWYLANSFDILNFFCCWPFLKH